MHGASPLSGEPGLAPATWFPETLGPFFFAGGYAAVLLPVGVAGGAALVLLGYPASAVGVPREK